MKTKTSKSSVTIASSRDKPFELDITTIKENARRDVEEGAHTSSYQGNTQELICQLNHALATELVCVLRYKLHYYTATGLSSEAIAPEFSVHAQEELEHADRIAVRIVQLGGKPDFSPEGLAERSRIDYVVCKDLREMIRENLVAERIAIDTYSALIRYIGDKDPTTRRMLEDILAKEEEHAQELADWNKRQ